MNDSDERPEQLEPESPEVAAVPPEAEPSSSLSASPEAIADADEAESSPKRISTHRLQAVTVPQVTRGVVTEQRKQAISAALFKVPETPIEIGRYTILRELGAGGMGVVYLAYDEQLDRRVAIKLLRRTKRRSQASARLQREAQALARLSHPNVTTVYETGICGDQLFVAMEYIRGTDMREWLVRHRPWREVLEVFAQAGAGLAAAHEAGLVHRDFKPDNVLIGDDGRVRVADFGLAYALDHPSSESSEEDRSERTGKNTLNLTLTKTGAVVGTPAYMAPEQFRGARTDERTDQFSYCLALWEALYGERPFKGSDFETVARSVLEGKICQPPSSVDVPDWLRLVVLRGLARSREERWPSMSALLEALGNDPEARRRRLLQTVGLGAVTLVVIVGLAWLAATELRRNARQRYWNTLTEQLLDIERRRSLAQVTDDARRARDATRMSAYRSYGLESRTVEHHDPTVAAVLLREVETDVRSDSAWISAANKTLGQAISYAVLTGHTGTVQTLAFAPDGAALYSGAVDGQVWRWDTASGRGEAIIRHDGTVTKIVVSPDGQRVISSSVTGKVRVWSLATGQAKLLTAHEHPIHTIAIDPDGRYLATASRDVVRIHEFDGETVALEGVGGEVPSLRFSPSGRRLAVGSAGGEVGLWTVDGDALDSRRAHTLDVYHLAFIDEQRLVSGADDGDIRLWTIDAQTGALDDGAVISSHGHAPVTALDVHGERVVSAADRGSLKITSLDGAEIVLRDEGQRIWAARFTPDGRHVAYACFDGIARLADADGGAAELEFTGHRLAILPLALGRHGRWMATGSYDGSVRLWDLTRPRFEIPLRGHTDALIDVEIDPESERVLTVSSDGSAGVWDLDRGIELAHLDGGHGSFSAARFDPRGERVAVATTHGQLLVWDPETGVSEVLEGHTAPIQELDFDASGERLASASHDRTARIWAVDEAETRTILRGHEGPVIAIDFGPGDAPVATASYDGSVRLWNPATGAEMAVLRGHTGPIHTLVRSPDGHTLATGSEDGTARLWPNDDPSQAIVLEGHHKAVWDVAFDAGGERVVTASTDGDARVWTTDGELVAILDGHAESVWSARFAPNDWIITASDDNTVRIWPLLDAGPEIVLSGHHGSITDLAIATSPARFVSGSADGTARIWRLEHLDVDPDSLLAKLEAVTGSCLSHEQRIRELGESPSEAQMRRGACEQRHGR